MSEMHREEMIAILSPEYFEDLRGDIERRLIIGWPGLTTEYQEHLYKTVKYLMEEAFEVGKTEVRWDVEELERKAFEAARTKMFIKHLYDTLNPREPGHFRDDYMKLKYETFEDYKKDQEK